MNIKIIALIENMSGFKCPSCGQVHDIFGKSKLDELAAKNNINTIVKSCKICFKNCKIMTNKSRK